MKWTVLLFFLASVPAFAAKPIVLVSYYDAFGKAPFNNSERVAKALSLSMGASTLVDLRLCPLRTVFDKAYGALEDCIKALEATPAMVLSLGEAGCSPKAEISVRNYDKTMGPDNEGNERKGEIIPGAPAFIAMRYPLPQMYCGLSPKERDNLAISSSAGSFVCNNTAFQLNHHYPELMTGFIHVPSNNCRGLEKSNVAMVKILSTMITKGVEFLQTQFIMSPNTPHSSNDLRLPISKDDLHEARKASATTDKCLNEFFKKARGVDESGFWSFLSKD